MIEAKYYKKLPLGKVQCLLCPHYCVIAQDDIGLCRGKKNIDGKLYATNYGKTVTLAIDPIEKKPLYHFMPGSKILSIASNSCNFTCSYCQNYHISQDDVATYDITPQSLLELCKKHNINSIAFTYTEPITWYEFILDTAKYFKENGLQTVMVTNGFINIEPLSELIKDIDAMNIDLKSMNDDFYKDICNGKLVPILDVIKFAYGKTHLEITNLLITGENDNEENISALIDFVASVSSKIPIHFSKYYPAYKMMNSPTPDSTLFSARDLAKGKLDYVYLGNIYADSNTYCPKCGEVVIQRNREIKSFIIDGKCPACGHNIYGVFR